MAALCYLLLACLTIDVDWTRAAQGLERGARFLAGFSRPDFLTRWSDISQGLLESLAMTAVATCIGVLISLPVAVGAARNVAPLPIYFSCRFVIVLSRSFHELIVAILFVVLVGFGPLAGVLTLSFASIGFIAKLLAEEIESIDRDQVEAIRSSGASWPQRMIFGVLPQVTPRLTGLTVYRLDINFRESAIIGVVGAGGIGATINTAFDRYEYDTAAAILLLIIAIVLAGEYGSGWLRQRLI
ncbi:MAG: phosphonate ABC transporter, permease protein PhnE [Acidobacteriota bacterium]|nr:MAG: phosphonate ABC transporter, permease protein PhnE [Acidobacteriota bacterium]